MQPKTEKPMSITDRNNATAELIAQPFLEALEAGEIPWEKPWAAGWPVSMDGREYRGLNPLLLDWYMSKRGWKTPVFLTLYHANAMGARVRKGEHAARVTFWKVLRNDKAGPTATGEPDGDTEQEERSNRPRHVLRYYFVFNVEQCDFPPGVLEKHLPKDAKPIAPLVMPEEIRAAGEAVWDGYADPPTRQPEGGTRAFYRPDTDELHMPPREHFKTAEGYYGVLFHEMTHSTGHAKRLDRIKDAAAFGSQEYGREELVAEIGSALLCKSCGFTAKTTEDTHKAYVANWYRAIKAKPFMLVSAAAAAQRAADWILGRKTQN